jgi:cytochrome P450
MRQQHRARTFEAKFMFPTRYSAPKRAVQDFLDGIVFQLYAMARGGAGGHVNASVVADAASIHEILSQPARFPKAVNMGLISALGDSRFTANGPAWKVRRDLTQNAYLQAGSAGNAAAVSAVYRARFVSCDATPEGVHRALMLASSEIFFRSLGCEADVEGLLGFFERARQYLKCLQYYSWNAPGASDLSALREEGSYLVGKFDEETSSSASISRLLTDFHGRAGELEDFNPLHELLMNFLAGIETTAATLSFAIDRLGIDPRVEGRLRAEIADGGQNAYFDCFLQETMRYFPAIPFVVREAAAETTLNDMPVAKGEKIILSIVGLHHNPSYWNEPEIFDCSRAEFMNNSYNRRAFLPYLAGPRMCGGARLANLELAEGLKAFVREFAVSGSTDQIGFDYGLALRPKS